MALTPLPPNTILLHGRHKATLINDRPIIDTGALPGMFVEPFVTTVEVPQWPVGTLAYRRVTSATNMQSKLILLEEDYRNHGVDDAYVSGSPALVAVLEAGMSVWALCPSGQNITKGDIMQQNGDGMLKEASGNTAAANVAHYAAMETLGATTTVLGTRLRTEVLQG
jgi:hypothetical protein